MDALPLRQMKLPWPNKFKNDENEWCVGNSLSSYDFKPEGRMQFVHTKPSDVKYFYVKI
jgi:hypothetical protein